MKKIILFSFIFAFMASIATEKAQCQYKYPFGSRVSSALTSATTISVTPAATLTLYTLAADTNVTFNAVVSSAVVTDMVVFRVKGNTRTRHLTWGLNMDALSDSIATGKTWTYTFIWDGTAYKMLGKIITD